MSSILANITRPKTSLPMAWNEPGDSNKPDLNKPKNGERDPWDRNNRRPDTAPDLDEILNKIKGIFSSGSNNSNRNSDQSTNNGSPKLGFIPVLIFVGAIGLWAASGIYIVDAGKQGVELVFGKYYRTSTPGLNWRYPSPIGAYRIINTENRFSQKLGTVGPGSDNQMLTKDEAIVDVQIEVQYQITDPQKYWFNVNDPDATLKQVVESAARERVGQTNLDDILTSGRAQLMAEVKALSQLVLDKYGAGITITNMNLQDAQPPNAVQSAFSDAIRSREDEQSRRNQADAYERQVVLEAEGEAAREINNAEGYRDRLIAEATGEASRFNQIYAAYKNAPAVTRMRLYIETMEQVLSKTSKIIMDEQGNNLMLLPIEQMLKGSAGNAPVVQQGLSSAQNSSSVNNLNSNINYSKPSVANPTKPEAGSATGEVRMRTRQ